MKPVEPPHIRAFTSADSAAVLAHFDVTWQATYAPDFARAALVDAARPPDPVARVCGGDGRMLLADAGGEIVGTAGFRVTAQVSYICAMYIRPDWQRRGLGTALLSAVLQQVPGDRNVVVYALSSSRAAIAFYETHGFTRFEERDFDFGSGIQTRCIGSFRPSAKLRPCTPTPG
jgi:ribosomal protein S18 acetylase RimI-like enzyme